MPHTFYGSIDLGAPVAIVGPTFVNCSDIGSAPFSPNFSGSFSENPYHVAGPGVVAKNKNLTGTGTWTAAINHSTPTNPIPSNAQIVRVTLNMQFSGGIVSCDINGTFDYGGALPLFNCNTRAESQLKLKVFASPILLTHFSSTDLIDVDTIDFDSTPALFLASSSLINLPGRIATGVYNLRIAPLGYMTYNDFITQFHDAVFNETVQCDVQAQFGQGGLPAGAKIDGVDTASATYQASNWEMDVEWYQPSSWTANPSTITVPDGVITITRPEPVKPITDDDEQVESIEIDGKKILPNDPWVEIWTRLKIVLHIPTDKRYVDPIIVLNFVGIEFSGRTALIPLTVTYADLSGIYQLDNSIYHDVLYDRTSTPTTQIVKIPSPFFVTHFVDTPETDVCHFTGTRMRVTGQGTIRQVMQSLDYIQTLQFSNFILRTSNNRNPFSLVNFNDQNASVRVYMNALNDFMEVSQMIIFYKAIFTGYPQ